MWHLLNKIVADWKFDFYSNFVSGVKYAVLRALWAPRNELDLKAVAYVAVRADPNSKEQKCPLRELGAMLLH